MQARTYRSVISGEPLTTDNCLVRLCHKMEYNKEKDKIVKDQHAVLFIEEYTAGEMAILTKFDLRMDYAVKHIICNTAEEYEECINSTSDNVREWASGSLAIRLIINSQLGRIHFISGKNKVLESKDSSNLHHAPVRKAIGDFLEKIKKNPLSDNPKQYTEIAELYQAYSGHLFSAITTCEARRVFAAQATTSYIELSKGAEYRGPCWILPKKVAKKLHKIMEDTQGNRFNYSVLGPDSIFSKIADRALQKFKNHAISSSSICVETASKVGGTKAAAIVRSLLSGSGHNCVSLALEILKHAITYVALTESPTPAIQAALEFLNGGVVRYFAAVTSIVLDTSAGKETSTADNITGKLFSPSLG